MSHGIFTATVELNVNERRSLPNGFTRLRLKSRAVVTFVRGADGDACKLRPKLALLLKLLSPAAPRQQNPCIYFLQNAARQKDEEFGRLFISTTILPFYIYDCLYMRRKSPTFTPSENRVLL